MVERFCRRCKLKDPPVHTVLKPGVNISLNAYERMHWICNTCRDEMNKEQRERNKESYAKYLHERDNEIIAQFEQEWNDPKLITIQHIPTRVIATWRKYGRRSPDTGLLIEHICTVMFPDMWFVDPNKIVQDYLDETNMHGTNKYIAKQYIMGFVSKNIDILQEGYRQQAKNKWQSIVANIRTSSVGQYKLIATPKYKDPHTKYLEARWFLLSTDEQLIIRTQIHETQQSQIQQTIKNETEVVDFAKIEIQKEVEQE